MNRRNALLMTLALLAAFEAGVAFDRWLHRPIRVAGMMLRLTSDSSSVPPPGAPIPPCMVNCEPNTDEDESPGDGEPESKRCYSDGSIPCAAPGRASFKLRPWAGPCPFDPLRNQACQQET